MSFFVSCSARIGRVCLQLLPIAVVASTVPGQLVTPRTVPVHQDQQFDLFPAQRPGMGGVTIAVNDTLFDPFFNPARATRLTRGYFFANPYSHEITGGRGGGRTVPVGGLFTAGNWSGTALVALQQLDRVGPTWNLPISDQTASNSYLQASLARRLPNGLSLGAAAYHAGLGAVDGVDLLYAGSDRIQQDGQLTDIRLGLTKEYSGQRVLDALLVHNRTNVVHDVHYTLWRWVVPGRTAETFERNEHNVDRTNIWGVHARYSYPLGTQGWRIGFLGTANRLSHPKIPNYVIQNIPRDPGNTSAFNAGAGVSRSVGGLLAGVDVVYEPMFADTWATAEQDTAVVGGGSLRAGERTVDNTFRFNNIRMRMGVSQEIPLRADSSSAIGLQAGLGAYAIRYRLKQYNHIQRSYRTQDEDWIEWSPSLGVKFRNRGVELQYTWYRTCGALGCSDRTSGGMVMFAPAAAGVLTTTGGIIAAPGAPLTLDGGNVSVHRITVALPIR